MLPLDEDITPAEINPPTNDEMQREYPPLALLMNIGGRAVVTCKATTEGRLDDCHLDSEEPAGLGFGAATVRASAYFTVKPARRGGTPVAAMITIPLRWQTDPSAKTDLQPEAPLPPVSAASLSLARQVLVLQDMKARALANWQPWLDQRSAQLVESGDAQSGQRVLDAFHQGLVEAVDDQAERSAHIIAAHMGEGDLRAAVAFLESPAGRAWTAANAQLGESEKFDPIFKRITAAARAHLCHTDGCTTSEPAKTATR